MAVETLSSINRYIGLSSDTKPSETLAGSTFFELDTENLYIFDGISAWYRANPNLGSEVGRKGVASFTRPSNTIAYDVGDIVSSSTSSSVPLTFSNIGIPNRVSYIIGARASISSSSVPSGNIGYRLHLFNSNPSGDTFLDNTPLNIPLSEESKYLGFITLSLAVDVGGFIWIQDNHINHAISFSSTNLYVYVETRGAYTPSSGSVMGVRLFISDL